mgnify:CR=1 FL=1
MACSVIQLREAIVKERTRLQSLLAEGNEFDDNGVSIKESLAHLAQMNNAAEDNDTATVAAVADIHEMRTGNTVLNRIRAALGDTVTVLYNGAKSASRALRITNAGMIDDVVTIETERGRWSFLRGQDRSRDTKRGGYVVVEGLGDITNDMEDTGRGNSASTDKSKINWKKLKEAGEGIHGVHGEMKAFMRMLDGLGKNKAKAKDLEYYDKLLDMFNPEFFKEMKIFYEKVAKGQEQFGFVEGNKIVVTYSNRDKLAGNEQSEAEIYMHETIHSLVGFALKSSDPAALKIKRELAYVMKQVRKEMDYKRLRPISYESKNKELEDEIAKEMYEYIFDSENAMDEFIAHALTNPIFRDALEKMSVKDSGKDKTMLEKVVGMFKTVMDVILGNYSFKEKNNNVLEQVMKLSVELAAINDKAASKAEEGFNLVTKINEMLDAADAATAKGISMAIEKITAGDRNGGIEALPDEATNWEKAVWLARYSKKLMSNDIYRNYFGHLLSAYWVRPEGIVRDIVGEFFDRTDEQKTAEMLSLKANAIDKQREATAYATEATAYGLFKEKLSEREKIAVTRAVLNTDLQSISGVYTNKELRQLMTDDAYLETQIGRHKHRIKELTEGVAKRTNWLNTQATGLGYFMATGKGNIAQLMNAGAITIGYGSSARHRFNWKVYREVETIATLVALKETKRRHTADVLAVAELMKTDYEGVKGVMNMQASLVKESEEKAFQGSKLGMRKGYTKEVFDDAVTIETALASQEEEMANRGFKKVGDVASNEVKGAPKMAVYVSNYFSTADWSRAAVRLTSKHSMGTTLTDIRRLEDPVLGDTRAEVDKLRLDTERAKLVKQIEAGTYDSSKGDNNLIPLVNPVTGEIVDYRYTMDLDMKEKLLKQDLSFGKVLGRSYGSIYDKYESNQHNKEIVKFIDDMMKNNWLRGTTLGTKGEQYYVLSEDVEQANLKEIYKILPKELKEYISSRPDGSLAIPANILNLLFGSRELSASEFVLFKKFAPTVVKTAIRIAEAIWTNVVQVAAANIVVKIPLFLIQNIISNIMYILERGGSVNLKELYDIHMESFRDTRRFIKDNRELVKLEAELKSVKGDLNRRERIQKEIARVKRDMEGNWTKALFDMSLYTPMGSDIDTKEESTNKLKRYIDKKLAGLPSFVTTPLHWMYLSEDTAIYKFNKEVLEMSDLVARAVLYRKMVADGKLIKAGKMKIPAAVVTDMNKRLEKDVDAEIKLDAKGMDKLFDEAYDRYVNYTLIQAFVNYDAQASSTENYLKRMGAIMFMPYAKRIQRVIRQLGEEHPIRSALSVLFTNYVLPMETITNQSIPVRNWYTVGMSPMTHIENAVTPALFKPETYGLH